MMKAIIEIPKGSKYKYEIDKENGYLILDRVIKFALPANYGYIPETLSEDGDALDLFLISNDPIPPLTRVTYNIIGVIKCIDNMFNDEKILAYIDGDKEPSQSSIDNIYYYLQNYKDGMVIKDFLETRYDIKEATKILQEARQRFQDRNKMLNECQEIINEIWRNIPYDDFFFDNISKTETLIEFEGIRDLLHLWKKETNFEEKQNIVKDLIKLVQDIYKE